MPQDNQFDSHLDQYMKVWYLSHQHAAKAQASMQINNMEKRIQRKYDITLNGSLRFRLFVLNGHLRSVTDNCYIFMQIHSSKPQTALIIIFYIPPLALII